VIFSSLSGKVLHTFHEFIPVDKKRTNCVPVSSFQLAAWLKQDRHLLETPVLDHWVIRFAVEEKVGVKNLGESGLGRYVSEVECQANRLHVERIAILTCAQKLPQHFCTRKKNCVSARVEVDWVDEICLEAEAVCIQGDHSGVVTGVEDCEGLNFDEDEGDFDVGTAFVFGRDCFSVYGDEARFGGGSLPYCELQLLRGLGKEGEGTGRVIMSTSSLKLGGFLRVARLVNISLRSITSRQLTRRRRVVTWLTLLQPETASEGEPHRRIPAIDLVAILLQKSECRRSRS
jgi:hypothetical protein